MTHQENIDISALLVGGDMVALFDGTRAIAEPSPEDTVDHGPEYPRAFRVGRTVIALMPDGQLLTHGHDDDAEAVECLTALRNLITMAPSPLDEMVPVVYGQGNGTFMVV